jgi:hypothetical protein
MWPHLSLFQSIAQPAASNELPFNVDSGLALGSFCIITGIILFVDAIVLVATKITKEK